ncbi:hypothetical protein JW916_00605 [Candidatus Sumerlaeota bacterium]|nr:hypothetical protein [Candidatus Sumerlaeota bacterium]
MRKPLFLAILVSLTLSIPSFAATKAGTSSSGTGNQLGPIKDAVIVKSAQTHLLSKPGKGGTQLQLLTKFTPVKVTGQSAGGYPAVETLAGKKGYVAANALADNAFISVDSKKPVNIRSGPGASDTILFTLQDTYPLAVLDKKGKRVKVVDFEGDAGWVHENLLSTKSYVIVRLKSINLRETPGLDASGKPTGRVLFTAPRGVVFQVVESDPKTGWLHLRHADGDDAWCSPKVVWGWLTD